MNKIRLTEIERIIMKWNLIQYSEDGGIELISQNLCEPLPTAEEVLSYQLKLSNISDEQLLVLYREHLTMFFSTVDREIETYKYFEPDTIDFIFEGRKNDSSFVFISKKLMKTMEQNIFGKEKNKC